MAATRLFSLVKYNLGNYPQIFTGSYPQNFTESYPRIFGAVARVTDFNPDSGLVLNADFLNSQIDAI